MATTPLVRRSLSFLVCLIATVVLAAGSASAAGTYNNLVQVDNSDNARPAVSTASMVSQDSGDAAVYNANLAYSHSFNCTGCRTVTAALQAVIIEGNPTTIAPQNAAVAINENCQSCQTFAYAQQYVFSPHHPVRIGEGTSRQLQAIQAAINWVANSNEDFTTMTSQLDSLSWAFCSAVQRAVQAGQDGQNSQASTNICGAAPFDHRQVQQHDD